MPSRRAVLGAGATVAASLGTLWTVRSGPVQTPDPPPDTWPQYRHDASNTARTNLSVPSEPTVAWSQQAVEPSFPSLVVGTDNIYVGGNGITALDRRTGRQQWHTDAGASKLALGNLSSDILTLYAAHGVENDVAGDHPHTLRAYETTDGDECWRHDLPSSAYSVVPSKTGIILGCHGSLLAVGRDDKRRWTEDPPGRGAVYPVIHQGTLYAGLPGYVRRYRRRRVLATLLRASPTADWQGRDTGIPVPPTVACGHFVMGNESPELEGDDPVIHAFDLVSGERVWGVDPQIPVDRQVLTPVQFGTTGITTFSTDEPDASVGERFVVGIDLQNGSFEFRQSVDAWFRHVAAGTDCAVFGGGQGELRAYRPDGSERWRTTVSGRVADLAVVGRQVIVVRTDGHVDALG